MKRMKSNFHKTGVINDPLGQPTDQAGSDCHLILKFWDGRTDNLCENCDHYQPGLWSGLRLFSHKNFIHGPCLAPDPYGRLLLLC